MDNDYHVIYQKHIVELEAECEKKEKLLQRWLQRNEALVEDIADSVAKVARLRAFVKSAIEDLAAYKFQEAKTMLNKALGG